MSDYEQNSDTTLLLVALASASEFLIIQRKHRSFSHLLYRYKLTSEASLSHEVPGAFDQRGAPPMKALLRRMHLNPRCHIPLEN